MPNLQHWSSLVFFWLLRRCLFPWPHDVRLNTNSYKFNQRRQLFALVLALKEFDHANYHSLEVCCFVAANYLNLDSEEKRLLAASVIRPSTQHLDVHSKQTTELNERACIPPRSHKGLVTPPSETAWRYMHPWKNLMYPYHDSRPDCRRKSNWLFLCEYCQISTVKFR